ncbi:hypothetical protein HR45_14695 [Shewanella mangrovi]|uniref:Outer membrane lipoprotein Blc n=1 Tax=Shewanella mangrovi TaxID=1515746 RepID=A0A094J9V5_9GAMM|nr:lipocalin family protein [Shewanella mangrovi]KFZ36705.1 hypothetical protein HR45_14695 [Shewanella mangrovi]
MKTLSLALALLLLCMSGCTSLDKKIAVVEPFVAQQYLGKWYEIGRLDHSFERGLTHVTAEYRQQADSIKVINRGFNPKTLAWQSADGVAYFTDGHDVGRLRVSFFWPFYGAYQIHQLIPAKPANGAPYQVSLVLGPNVDYMWILARTPQITAETKQALVEQAAALGVNTNDIIWVDQSSPMAP